MLKKDLRISWQRYLVLISIKRDKIPNKISPILHQILAISSGNPPSHPYSQVMFAITHHEEAYILCYHHSKLFPKQCVYTASCTHVPLHGVVPAILHRMSNQQIFECISWWVFSNNLRKDPYVQCYIPYDDRREDLPRCYPFQTSALGTLVMDSLWL